MSDIMDLLNAKAKRPERTQHVCIAADLVDKHRIASAELAELLDEERRGGTSPKRLGATSPARKKAEEVTALEVEMADATIAVKLVGVIPAEWREWRADNPPREGNALDEQFGLNSEALITDMTRRCIAEPEFSDKAWAKWLADIAASEQLALAVEVYALHERRVDIPKSQLASLVTTSSDGDSKQRLGSE